MRKQDWKSNPHHNKETGNESPKVHDCIACVAHKVIWVCAFCAYEVRQWCYYIGCDDQEGEEVVEEGCGEDDEEEADC